jgi:hypothetical protein
MPAPEELVKPPAVAAALNTTVSALTQMRYRRVGPPYTRIGNRIRYRWSDVEKYLADRTVTPESA